MKRVQSVQPCAAGRKPTEIEWCETSLQLRTIRKQERRQCRRIRRGLLAYHYPHCTFAIEDGKANFLSFRMGPYAASDATTCFWHAHLGGARNR